MKHNLLEEVITAVKEAAKIATDAQFSVESKGSVANVVTSADLSIQNFLKEKLQQIVPSSGFLGEESNLSELNADYIWIVDPIDGTMNFTRGVHDSAISVALQHNGELILGVVYNFFTDDLYYAERGKGAFNNGKQIHASNRPFNEGLLCTAMSLYKKEYAPVCFDIIAELYAQCNDIRRFGSCAMELCYIAAGKCDLYFELRVYAWDSAAGELILREAGASVYRFFSDKMMEKALPLIAANNAQNLEKIYDVVNKHLTKYNLKEKL